MGKTLMKDIYWRKMYTFKYQIEYLNLNYKVCLDVKRTVLIGTTIVSSGAIAAWVEWTDKAFVWGCIILLMQVVSAVYDILPIKKRTDVLAALIGQLDNIYLDVEKTWQEVRLGKKSDEEINDLIYDFEKRWIVHINKALIDDMIPTKKRREKKAAAITKTYMDNILREKE